MINVIYKKKFLKIKSIWFADYNINLSKGKQDFVFYHGIEDVPSAALSTSFFQEDILNTLVTNLLQNEEEHLKKIKKNYKYEINRATKEGVVYRVYDSKDLLSDKQLLKSFKQDYEVFTKLKGVASAYNAKALDAYLQADAVFLTIAKHKDKNLVQHLYLCDDKNSRLLYSVSNFRTQTENRSLIGMANKGLHWFDIIYFKKNGLSYLDWGGITSFENPNGIDKFKIGFGGEKKQLNNLIIGVSLLGKAVIYLKNKRLSKK